MNYFSILYIVIFLSVLLLGIWIYSEKNLKGKYNKLIKINKKIGFEKFNIQQFGYDQ